MHIKILTKLCCLSRLLRGYKGFFIRYCEGHMQKTHHHLETFRDYFSQNSIPFITSQQTTNYPLHKCNDGYLENCSWIPCHPRNTLWKQLL